MDRICNHDEIASKGLSKRNNYFANKRQSPVPKWGNQMSVNKKSIYSIVNSKGIHTNSNDQFKHHNNIDLGKKSKNTNGFLDRHDKIPAGDYFNIKKLMIKDQKKNAGLEYLSSNSPDDGKRKGNRTPAFPELVRKGSSSNKLREPVNSRKNGSLNNLKKFTTGESSRGLIYKETGKDRSKSSRNNYSQISNFLQKTGSKNTKGSYSISECNFQQNYKKYFQNVRDLNILKSSSDKSHFSKMSSSKNVNESGKNSDSLQINRNKMKFSFWPDRSKDIVDNPSLQGRYSDACGVSSLLFPRKCDSISSSLYSCRKNDQKYKFKVHNNMLKASNDSSFKVPYKVVREKDTMKPNHILPETLIFGTGNEMNDQLKGNKRKSELDIISGDCNIGNGLKSDLFCIYNVGQVRNMKYFSLADSGNPKSGSVLHHRDFNQERETIRISDLLFPRNSCRNFPSSKSSVEKCVVYNSGPEINQEKITNLEENSKLGAGSEKVLEKNLIELSNSVHSHDNDNPHSENFKIGVTKKESSSIHCNELNFNKNEKEKGKQPPLSNEKSSRKILTENLDCNPATNHEIGLNKMSMPRFVKNVSKDKESLNEANYRAFGSVTKNNSDKKLFKTKDNKQNSHSSLNFSKSITNEKFPCRFEHLLHDSNSSNVSITENFEKKLVNCNSQIHVTNKNDIPGGPQNSHPIGNVTGWNSSQYLFSCDHNKKLKIKYENNFHHVSSKSNRQLIDLFENYGKYPGSLSYVSSKQNQFIMKEKPLVSSSNTPANHNNIEIGLIKDHHNNSTNQKTAVRNVDCKLTTLQLPSIKNDNDISQFSKNVNEERKIQNKVSEKNSGITETSNFYTTPYYSTLNPQRSDVGNDSLNFQHFIGENINAVRPNSTFDRAPYYHSVEDSHLQLGAAYKYSYCSNSTSESSKFMSENHLPIDSNSIFKDSFGFCHRQIDDKTQLDTLEILPSDSKFEKEEHIERSLKDNLSAKTPEKTEECNSKNVNFGYKLDTLMREKDIITYNLKAIIDFCFSLNILPKTEMTHRDVPLKLLDDDKVKSNDKVRKMKDEIFLNRMKTIIEAFPPRKTIKDINHSNKENLNIVLNQRQCSKYQHEENENNQFKKVIPGCDSKNIANVSDAYNIRSNTVYYSNSLQNNSPLTDNRDTEIDRISEKSFHMKIRKCKMSDIDHINLEKDCNEFRILKTLQNRVQRSEPKANNPSIDVTSNSDYNMPQNMNSSNSNENEVLVDGTKERSNYSCGSLVPINENRNHCQSLSNTKKCDQAQKVSKYQDSHAFEHNSAVHNYKENGFGNNAKIADDTQIVLNNECMKEDYDFLNSTSFWNICDRQKYFKLNSILRNAIFHRNKIDEQNDLSTNSKYLNDKKSMTDRDKFKDFSNFLKEAILERENIYKRLQIAPFKNKSLTCKSDPILCLGSPSSQVEDSKVEISDRKPIEFSNYSLKELEEQTKRYGSVDNVDCNSECKAKLKCLNSCNESNSLNNLSKIMKLGENFDIHTPNEQLIRRNSLQSSTIGSVYNIALPVALKRPITKNNCDNYLSISSNHLSTAFDEESNSVQLEKAVDASKLRGRSQSDLNLNCSGANTFNELDKFKLLLRHSSSSDIKMKFFNSLKLSTCRQISNYSVKSETISNHAQPSNNSKIFSNDREKLVNKEHLFKSSVYPQNLEDTSFMSSSKAITSEEIVFPEILEDCCVLQEQGAAACEEGHLKGGDSLGETSTKTASKTSRKQKPKSKPSKTSVNNKSYSTVTGTNDVEKLLGNQSSSNSCINLTCKKLDYDEGTASKTINLSYNQIGKSNPNIVGNVIDHVEDKLHVNSLFPLINLRKSHLEYETCVEPVINISYESLCKNVLSGLPSVGKILSETMPAAARAALERWKKNMIAQLGEEGFQKLNKENLARGALFHEYVRRYLVGETSNDELPEKVQHYFKSLAAVFPHISDVKVVESHVAHPQLHYCGFIDCVAKYDGTPVVIEWKLAEKPKPDIRSTYDAPLQMSAYLGALNYDDNYNFPVASGVVVAAYTDGSPANVFYLPEEKCVNYWESFQMRLQEFKELKSVKLK
ncbi:hypothetical protein LSTR_LSTR000159 [Laodelphax striatellus]|uniref:Mitochondrial genome maintenance exonuclease 1 n=1 Tax=Laodelphax striatellus TaxID=195883 RepID=A0A482X6A0_LAOST|nr:hypothetical protein LSTR_LSTR000159 [Laodelphax striatellus]